MKNKLLNRFFLLLVLFAGYFTAAAQGGEGYGEGFKIKFDTSGQKYIRFITWHQLWFRYNENNPGSTVNGKQYGGQFDMALRRSRLLIMTQLTPKFMIMVHAGINNQNIVSGGAFGQGANGADGKKPQFFIHEATMEHKVYKDYLIMGAGLHYYGGLSRKTMASTLNFMTLDAPIFNWHNIETTDQFARNFGAFAKGKVKGFEYRVAFYQPFDLTTTNAFTKLDTSAAKAGVKIASYRGIGHLSPAVNGYFQYQFFDKEAFLLPYTVGSYFGSKKVFNIGAGFDFQPNSMWWLQRNVAAPTGYDTVISKQYAISGDVFLDMPFKKAMNTALTLYAVYYYFNMGPNFVRNIGISNPANGTTGGVTFNGAGNSFPTVGTGHIFYTEAGFMLPATKKVGKFQVYSDVAIAKYQRLKDPVIVYDAGVNWLLHAHHCKITFNYRLRPGFDYANPASKYGDIVNKYRKGEFTLQFQAYL